MTNVKRRQFLLMTGDFILMYVALVLTLLVRYSVHDFEAMFVLHQAPMTFVFVIWLVLLYANGMYDLALQKPSLPLYRRLFESLIICLIVAAPLFYVLPFFGIAPKTNLVICLGFFAALLVLWRLGVSALGGTRIRTLIVYPSAELLEVITTLAEQPQFGYEIAGVVAESVPPLPKKIQYFPHTTPLRAIASEHNINVVVVGQSKIASRVQQELYELLFWHMNVVPADTFISSITGRIPLEALSEEWFFHHIQSERIGYDLLHRAFDYVAATIGLAVLAVLFPFVALGIKLTSPGPLFYLQERVGKNGKQFKVIKFRTMRALTKDGGAETAGAVTTTDNDPRITHLGKWIRRMRIDELPQVINILRGEMSFIGPRPERPQFVYEFERIMPYYPIRHLINPGITGWAQVTYPYAATPAEQIRKFQYDLYYIKNRSVVIDLAILLKTLHVVFYQKGR